MDADALRSYVDRSRELVASSPELSERNTQIRLVQPFLTALGWELHQIAADYRIETDDGAETVDIALLIEDEPAVLVETSACAEDLERDQAAELGRALLESDVDRGVLTNGRGFVFVAVSDGGLERLETTLQALPDNADAVAEYSRSAAVQRRRRDAAAALAADRDVIVDDLTARLVRTAGDGVADAVRAETERFVDDLIGDFRGRPADGDVSTRSSTEDRTVEEAADDETPPDSHADDTPQDGRATSDETPAGRRADENEDEDEDHPDADAARPEEYDVPADALGGAVADDGQYVVRFFGRRTSVWAVGHARAAMTAAQAIEYLLRRSDETITPPWGPDDADRTLLREEPIENATIELSDGLHLDARAPVAAARTAIETLAEDAGLRPMFQGEWATD